MNIKDIEAAIAWAKEGDRSITMDIGSRKESYWAYDYELKEGVHINSTKDLPTKDQLLEKKRKMLEIELGRIIDEN